MPGFSEKFNPRDFVDNAFRRLIRPQVNIKQRETLRMPAETRLSIDNVLRMVKDQYHIQSVFYPGSGSDKIDGIFDKVVYFDSEEFGRKPYSYSIQGFYYYDDNERSTAWSLPFKDNTFDALYHNDPDQLSVSSNPLIPMRSIPLGIMATHEFLRVIKEGGYILYDFDPCELSTPLEVYKSIPGIELMQKVKSYDLCVLQKTKPISLDYVENAFKGFYPSINS